MDTKHINDMKKYKLEISQDSNPGSPREWYNLGTMVCFHRRYDLGDENDYCSSNYDGWDEMKEDIIEKENVHTILPLYLYDHSGITISKVRSVVNGIVDKSVSSLYPKRRLRKKLWMNQRLRKYW